MATRGSQKQANSATTVDKAAAPQAFESRAVVRLVEAGSYVDCALCGERIKFQAKHRHQQAICNVYVDGKWDRVEQYHAECYIEAGQPYGKVPE